MHAISVSVSPVVVKCIGWLKKHMYCGILFTQHFVCSSNNKVVR